MERHTQTEGVV